MSDGTIAGGHFGSVQNQGAVPGTVVSSVVSGDTLITTTNVAGVVTIQQQIAAGWDVDKCRVYAVDFTNGNDANRGYADPTATGAAAYAVACAAAGLVAKKTFAGLAAIFPRVGRGRMVEIVVLAATYTDSPELALNGVVGYASGCPTMRGTATQATAGSVAFAGTTADATFAGHVVVPTLNAAGYNAIGSPTTSVIQCQKVGGAVAGFGAAPAVPDGTRIRFDSATPTVALRNICRQVCHVSGTDTVSLQTVLPAVPVIAGAGADIFYFEQPGVVVPAVTLTAPPQSGNGMQIVGMRSTGALVLADIRIRLVCVLLDGALTASGNVLMGLTTSQTYTHPVLGSTAPGGYLRTVAGMSLGSGQYSLSGAVGVTSLNVGGSPGNTSLLWGAGCANRNINLTNCRLATNDTTGFNSPNIGVTTAAIAAAYPRLFGGGGLSPLIIDGCDVRLGLMSIENAAGFPCIKVNGLCRIVFSGVVSGTTANTDVGLDLQGSILSTIEFRASNLPTVAGTAGEIRMSSQALAAYGNTTFEELWDQGANHLFQGNTNGAAYRATMDPSVYAGVVNGGAIAGYAAVRIQPAASGQVTAATADTLPNATGLVGIMEASAVNGAQCLYGGMGGYKVCVFDGAAPIVPGTIAYLSDNLVSPGTLTCTVPVVSLVKAKLRVGMVVDNSLPFNLAIVRMSPELQPVLADGLP